ANEDLSSVALANEDLSSVALANEDLSSVALAKEEVTGIRQRNAQKYAAPLIQVHITPHPNSTAPPKIFPRGGVVFPPGSPPETPPELILPKTFSVGLAKLIIAFIVR
ncbi:MAG: hypothetical protein J6S21_07485, partial [Victivallales bacterium]|nr:hypothetical protein [Victivallales bacterium]